MKVFSNSLAGIALGLLIMTAIGSCKKSNNSDTVQYYLSSLTSTLSNSSVVDSFKWDSNNRMGTWVSSYSYMQWGEDNYYSFSYAGNNSWPSTYLLSISGSSLETHQLSYDSKNRIIRDSALAPNASVTYFSYGENFIASNIIFHYGDGTHHRDTLFLTNGNISSLHTYHSSRIDTDTAGAIITFTYSSQANPLYNSKLSSAIGPLIWVNSFHLNDNIRLGFIDDAISVNLFSSVAWSHTFNPYAASYARTSDNLDRTIQMNADNAGAPNLSFRYY